MKAIRKIFPAIAMLLISAVMMSTATFAWFSMNTTVSASGMSIQAKSASLFLQIINNAEGSAFSNTENQVTAEAVTKGQETFLNPTAPTLDTIAADGNATFNPLTKTEFKYDAISWVNTFSNDVAVSDKANGNMYKEVTEAGYVLKNTFKVRLNPAAGNMTGKDLTVTSVTINETSGDGSTEASKSLLKACRLMIAGPDGVAVFDSTGTLIAGDANILSALAVDTEYTIDVYFYFDGEDKACFTNQVVNTDVFNAQFALTVSAAA